MLPVTSFKTLLTIQYSLLTGRLCNENLSLVIVSGAIFLVVEIWPISCVELNNVPKSLRDFIVHIVKCPKCIV